MPSRWQDVANALETLLSSPTPEQVRLAEAVGVELAGDLPARVAAAILADSLANALMAPTRRLTPNFEALERIEQELDIEPAPVTEHTSAKVVSAWIAARYSEKTLRGLRSLQPVEGDVVEGSSSVGRRLISSVGSDGRIYLRGRPTRSAWPNNLVTVARSGDPEYESEVFAIDAGLRNSQRWYDGQTSAANFAPLSRFSLSSDQPPPEAIRELEELLESGQTDEGPFQSLVERYPEMLASLVFGHHGAFVIPQQRLGAEHVTDFLVLGLNSLGPQWIAVELEAPRHAIVNGNGSLSTPTRHAVQQIQDWREWLTTNVAYAQTQLNLHSITDRVPGVVIIGRDDPTPRRQVSRSQVAEQQHIQIHSWDWFLRQSRQGAGGSRVRIGDFPTTNPSLIPSAPSYEEIDVSDEWDELEF